MARPPLALGTTDRSTSAATTASGSPAAASATSTASPAASPLGHVQDRRPAALQDELRSAPGSARRCSSPTPGSARRPTSGWARSASARADSTADTYASCLRNQVLPQLGELRLSECDTAHLDAFFSRLERARKVVEQPDGTTVEKPQLAANTRRMIRAIVGGVMQQAVLHQAVAANPVRDLERIESPKGHKKAPPRGLTAEERRRLLAYVDTDKTAVRADMPDLIRFALGSGLRIGEICAGLRPRLTNDRCSVPVLCRVLPRDLRSRFHLRVGTESEITARRDPGHCAASHRPANVLWSTRQAIDVSSPLIIRTHQAVGRHAARRSLSVLGGARPEMLVGEQELLGWHALVCGVELYGLSRTRPVFKDRVNRRSGHLPTPSFPVAPRSARPPRHWTACAARPADAATRRHPSPSADCLGPIVAGAESASSPDDAEL